MEFIDFKVIKGYDNLYCINPDGIVVSPSYVDKAGKFRKMKFLSIKKRGKGYSCVGLMKDGKQKSVSIHRLVAENFISNQYDKPQVNHIDGNKENNNVDNLEWVTNKENIIHSYKSGLREGTCHVGERNNMAKLTEKRVKEILASEKSASYLAKIYGVSISCIYKIRQGARWRSFTSH